LTKSSGKSSPPPKPGQLNRTGYAVLVKDKMSSARRWHTFGNEDKEGTILSPNEPLVLATNLFNVGTRVDIYERAE
jgi:hypothetical protein